MTKKILIIAVIIFILAAGAGWYFIFVRNPIDTNGNQIEPNNSDLFPVGQDAANAPAGSSAPNQNVPAALAAQSNLNRISSDRTAGATIIKDKSGVQFVRYVDRATGNIFNYNLASKNTDRLSNTTIPKIHESVWLASGARPILRYINEAGLVIAYSIELPATLSQASTTPNLKGVFLQNGMTAVAASPDSNKLFYISSTSSGGEGYTVSPDGSKKTKIFSSPVKEWQASWPAAGTIALTTKPSESALGVLYFLDAAKGTMRKILGDVYSLVTRTDPSATKVLYTSGVGDITILNTKTGTEISVPLQTLADKCVWSRKNPVVYCGIPNSVPSASYPDAWYEGVVSFSDNIYKIDATTGTMGIVGQLTVQYEQNIDTMDLSLSPNEDYLVFTNKKDLSLWSLALAGASTSTPAR